MVEQETQNVRQNRKQFIHTQPRHKNENTETVKSWIFFPILLSGPLKSGHNNHPGQIRCYGITEKYHIKMG